jgi:hypothetical protein
MIFVHPPRPAVARQGGAAPSLPDQPMAFGCGCVALANLVMAAAARTAAGRRARYGSSATSSPPSASCILPDRAGLDLELPRALSMTMGIWFATTLPGDILAGYLGGFWSSMAKPGFFVMIALVAAGERRGLDRGSLQKSVVSNQ